MPLGILYQNRENPATFETHMRGEDRRPLYESEHDHRKIQELFETY
jgi:hypothetical protein